MSSCLPIARTRPWIARGFLLCVVLLAANLLTACGEESDLEGTGAAPEREAEAGESVQLVLDNDSNQGYRLSLYDAGGATVSSLTAPAGERGQQSAKPRTPGEYSVAIHPVGDRAAAQEFPVEVSEN